MWVGHLWPPPFSMKLLRVLVLASLGLTPFASRAADATSPVDATQRNATFSPAGTLAPTVQKPQASHGLQSRRVEVPVLDKLPAAAGERRTPIDPKEAGEKPVQEKRSQRPRVVEVPLSDFSHRRPE